MQPQMHLFSHIQYKYYIKNKWKTVPTSTGMLCVTYVLHAMLGIIQIISPLLQFN